MIRLRTGLVRGENLGTRLGLVGMSRPKGRGFAAFWSENGCRLNLFCSGIGYGFRGNYRECMNVFIISVPH